MKSDLLPNIILGIGVCGILVIVMSVAVQMLYRTYLLF